MFLLPTLLWRGKPLPENPSGKSDDYDNIDYNGNNFDGEAFYDGDYSEFWKDSLLTLPISLSDLMWFQKFNLF